MTIKEEREVFEKNENDSDSEKLYDYQVVKKMLGF